MSWQVRSTTAEDAEQVAAINVRAWQHAYAGLIPAELLSSLEVEPRAQRLRERFATHTSADGYVAVDEHGAVAGYCWFGDYRPDPDLPAPGPGWSEVYAIYVDPERIGTGAVLMRAALTALAPRPVAVWVLEGNAHARRFYEHFRFVPDGVVTDFDADGTSVPEVRYVRIDVPAAPPGA